MLMRTASDHSLIGKNRNRSPHRASLIPTSTTPLLIGTPPGSTFKERHSVNEDSQ